MEQSKLQPRRYPVVCQDRSTSTQILIKPEQVPLPRPPILRLRIGTLLETPNTARIKVFGKDTSKAERLKQMLKRYIAYVCQIMISIMERKTTPLQTDPLKASIMPSFRYCMSD